MAIGADDPQPEPLLVDERDRGAVSADRGPADLGDDADDFLHGKRLGKQRGRLLQPGGAQRGRGQLLGEPAAHLVGLALAGDIGARAHPLHDRAIPLDRHRPDVVVAVRAGLRADPVTAVENRAGLDAAEPVPLDPVAVVRVDGGEPAVGQVLIDRLAGDPAPLGESSLTWPDGSVTQTT